MSDDTFTVAESHERIWLSPQCEDERTWCQDELDDCDECHSPAVKYIRHDLYEAVCAERDRLKAALEMCYPMAIVWTAAYQVDFGLSSPHPAHQEALETARQALSPTQEAGDE